MGEKKKKKTKNDRNIGNLEVVLMITNCMNNNQGKEAEIEREKMIIKKTKKRR